MKSKLRQSHELARENILKLKQTNKKYYDKNKDKNPLKLKINDLVLILKTKKNFKFEDPYEGPYRVEDILSPVTIQVKKGNKSIKIHIDRVKKATAEYGANTPPRISSQNV